MSASDPTLAIAAYLKSVEAVNNLTEGRIYRPELSTKKDASMPLPLVIVRPSGGGVMFGKDYLPIMDARLDCVCYGSTRLEAENVAREVQLALKELRRSVWEEVVLLWARITGGVASLIDPETNWTFSMVATQVCYAISTS
jgi:hypothetical protein